MSNKNLKVGIIAGLIAGIVFGIMLVIMGIIPKIAMLVGSESFIVGVIVHLIISSIIGIGFVWLFGKKATDTGKSIGWGLVYGVIWWFLGPLIIMPIVLGVGPQLTLQGMSNGIVTLLGHLIFGAILGWMYILVKNKDINFIKSTQPQQ